MMGRYWRGLFPSELKALVFALLGDSLFFVCAKKSKQKKAPPDIWPRLRRGSLLPMPLRGPAYTGHPCPVMPLAASMRLAPLRDISTRPSDGDVDSELPVSFSFALGFIRTIRQRKTPLQEGERSRCVEG